jgi:hypothetical protein
VAARLVAAKRDLGPRSWASVTRSPTSSTPVAPRSRRSTATASRAASGCRSRACRWRCGRSRPRRTRRPSGWRRRAG